METQDCIKEGDSLILKKEDRLKYFKFYKKRFVLMDKKKFLLDAALGQAYGTVWEVRNRGDIAQIDPSVIQAEHVDSVSAGDNRNIVDDSSTQKLSREDISSLKESGHSGESLVEKLVENSASFKDKNVYSQAKYRKKKRDKHLTRFQILRPSTRLLCEMYWNRPPSNKTIQLRADTLAQILTSANIQANSKVMLVENTQGLVLGAMMERMAGHGTIIQFHSEDQPVRLVVDNYNFPSSYRDPVHAMLLGNVGKLLKDMDSNESSQAQQPEKAAVKMETESGDIEQTVGETSSTEQSVEPQEQEKCDSASSQQDGSKTDPGKDGSKTDPGKDGSKTDPGKDGSKTDPGKDERKTDPGSTSDNGKDSDKVKDQGEVAMETSSTKDGDGGEKQHGRSKRKMETPEEREAKYERQQKRQQAFDKVKEILQSRDMDALVLVTKFQPSSILMALIEFLALSRPFVVYCPNIEPLMECYLKLRERGGAVSLRITETWLRHYQVLPKRTHPLVTMSGTGGYLLSGITVQPPPPEPTAAI